MVNLKTEDRRQLIDALVKIPILGTYRGRRLILENAGLSKLLPLIDLEGSPYLVVSEIVGSLSNYNHIAYGHEALGQFINILIEHHIGIDEEKILTRLLREYSLMVPAVSRRLNEGAGNYNQQAVQEKIIGENTLRPISFLSRGFSVGRSVVFIDVGGRWAGTGFLIAPDLVLTACHILPDKYTLSQAIFRFNYQLDFLGCAETFADYHALPDGLYTCNSTLDYAIVQLDGYAGDTWGWLPIRELNVETGERVNIIQHPGAQPKQVSIQNNFVTCVDKRIVQYLTPTLPGSSGSPVFNDSWEVVALHRGGGNLPEPGTGRYNFVNEGVLSRAVLIDLPDDLKRRVIST